MLNGAYALPGVGRSIGAARRLLGAIFETGLAPMARRYVHLSVDLDTARRVGERRDARPAILEVAAGAAFAAGLPFYRGNDKVWLAESVPNKYLTRIE